LIDIFPLAQRELGVPPHRSQLEESGHALGLPHDEVRVVGDIGNVGDLGPLRGGRQEEVAGVGARSTRSGPRDPGGVKVADDLEPIGKSCVNPDLTRIGAEVDILAPKLDPLPRRVGAGAGDSHIIGKIPRPERCRESGANEVILRRGRARLRGFEASKQPPWTLVALAVRLVL
jgi:hypothetical protein